MFPRSYNEEATYWGAPVSDGLGGNTYNAPIQFFCRWEERQEEFVNSDGELKISNAIVFANRSFDTLGYLYLGVSVAADPTTVSGAWRILGFRNIPAVSGRVRERRAFL